MLCSIVRHQIRTYKTHLLRTYFNVQSSASSAGTEYVCGDHWRLERCPAVDHAVVRVVWSSETFGTRAWHATEDDEPPLSPWIYLSICHISVLLMALCNKLLRPKERKEFANMESPCSLKQASLLWLVWALVRVRHIARVQGTIPFLFNYKWFRWTLSVTYKHDLLPVGWRTVYCALGNRNALVLLIVILTAVVDVSLTFATNTATREFLAFL